jgi:RND family efflux transporter MFP subunit
MDMRKILALVVGAIIFIGCGHEKTTDEKPIKYVKTQKILHSNNLKEYIFNGKIKEKSDVMLSFRVGGPLSSMKVKVGDYVKKGDVIATIDKRDYKLQLQSAKARYNQLEGEYSRYKELYKKGKLPANSYEKIESGYLLAKAGYENAVNQLNDTELRTPVSGYIYNKLKDNHETIEAGHPIVSVIDVSNLEVVVNVPASQLINIDKCYKNFVDVKNAGVFDKPVSLLSISEKTGHDELYEVRFLLNNSSENTIRSGMSAKVTLLCEDVGTTNITVPVEAVFHKKGKNLVWVFDMDSSRVKSREISLKELRTGGKMEVLSGLNMNDVIITAGVNSLVENQQVKPLPEKSETNIGGIL